jgi:hypothetical protein
MKEIIPRKEFSREEVHPDIVQTISLSFRTKEERRDVMEKINVLRNNLQLKETNPNLFRGLEDIKVSGDEGNFSLDLHLDNFSDCREAELRGEIQRLSVN